MRLEALRIRSLGTFRDFELDLSAYDSGALIAVCGANGAGKSTMLELGLPGAMYRQTPTRGSLVDLATARDAMLEVRLVNGSTWTLRHLVDAVSKKSEAIVLDGAGAAVTTSGKVREFDAWAAKHLPAPEVLFSSIFAPQGAAGFLGASPGDRKAVLLRVLGVERLERLAENARKREASASSALAALLGRIADARGGVLTVEAAEVALAAAEQGEVDKDRLQRKAQEQLEASEQESRRVADLVKDRAALLERRAEIEAALERVNTPLPDLELRLQNNRSVLADADAIRAAAALLEQLRPALKEADARSAAAQRERGIAATKRAAAKETLDATARARVDAVRAGDRATDRLADEPIIKAAAAELAALRVAVADAEAEQARLEQGLEALREQRIAGADERLTALRGGFERIIELRDDEDIRVASIIADNALTTDDETVTLAKELPAQVKAAEAALKSAKDRLAAAQRKLADAQQTAARAGELAAARADLEAANKLEVEIAERYAAEALAWNDLDLTLAGHEGTFVGLAWRVEELQLELDAAKPLAAKAEPLARAETRVAELEPQVAAARAELARLEAQLAAVPVPAEPPAAPDLGGFRKLVEDTARAAKEAHGAVAAASRQLVDARAADERVSGLEVQRAGLEADLADWARLASDLGRSGLQAAEIDAAGPELTELTNDLLQNALGPRFTVSFETTRLSADGKRQLEGCEVRVLDTVKGREAEASTFSGGEKVLLGEATSLAIAMLGCRRSGLEGVTLVRDESGAALDPENARAYVAMLRRAAQIVRARNVLFVSHSPEVQELADARIYVGGAA